jgi:hypothetical protein
MAQQDNSIGPLTSQLLASLEDVKNTPMKYFCDACGSVRRWPKTGGLRKALCQECTDIVPDHIPEAQGVRFATVIYERRMKNEQTM